MTEVMKTPPPSTFSPHLRPSDSDRSNHRRSNRQQRSYSRQPSTDREDSEDELRDPSEWDYPDQVLQRHMELLDEKRAANLERINNVFELQKENLKKMSDAFEYQAWEDFAFSRLSLRRSMTEHVCEKIVKLQDELEGRPIARANTNPLHLAWNPPERPESINILFGKKKYVDRYAIAIVELLLCPLPLPFFPRHTLTITLDSQNNTFLCSGFRRV